MNKWYCTVFINRNENGFFQVDSLSGKLWCCACSIFVGAQQTKEPNPSSVSFLIQTICWIWISKYFFLCVKWWTCPKPCSMPQYNPTLQDQKINKIQVNTALLLGHQIHSWQQAKDFTTASTETPGFKHNSVYLLILLLVLFPPILFSHSIQR